MGRKTLYIMNAYFKIIQNKNSPQDKLGLVAITILGLNSDAPVTNRNSNSWWIRWRNLPQWSMESIPPVRGPCNSEGPDKTPWAQAQSTWEERHDQPLASRSCEIKRKHDDHDDETSSCYQKNTKLSNGNKHFNHYEPLCKIILHKKFKFKSPNYGRKYGSSVDPFDHLANYHVAMYLQRVTDEVVCRAFATNLEKGTCECYNNRLMKGTHAWYNKGCPDLLPL